MEEAGLNVRIDAAANVIGRHEGKKATACDSPRLAPWILFGAAAGLTAYRAWWQPSR